MPLFAVVGGRQGEQSATKTCVPPPQRLPGWKPGQIHGPSRCATSAARHTSQLPAQAPKRPKGQVRSPRPASTQPFAERSPKSLPAVETPRLIFSPPLRRRWGIRYASDAPLKHPGALGGPPSGPMGLRDAGGGGGMREDGERTRVRQAKRAEAVGNREVQTTWRPGMQACARAERRIGGIGGGDRSATPHCARARTCTRFLRDTWRREEEGTKSMRRG